MLMSYLFYIKDKCWRTHFDLKQGYEKIQGYEISTF